MSATPGLFKLPFSSTTPFEQTSVLSQKKRPWLIAYTAAPQPEFPTLPFCLFPSNTQFSTTSFAAPWPPSERMPRPDALFL